VELRVDAVRDGIAAACSRAGRDPGAVTIVGVTKYVDVAAARALVAAGVRDLGENQYQQLRDRAPELTDLGVRWHAIGPLQRNKVRYVAAWATAFHALERLEVAEALSARRVADGGDPIDCYVEVNVAGESTKSGVDPSAVGEIVDGCRSLPGLRVVGLMTMPPLAASPEDSRRWFRMLAELAAHHGLGGLSMGTSADYEVAVEEGATVVRIGTALFSDANVR
jgi:PLP dependent protein